MALLDWLTGRKVDIDAVVERAVTTARESWANNQVEFNWRRQQGAWLDLINGGSARVNDQDRRAHVGRSRLNALSNPMIVRAIQVYFTFVFGRGIGTPRLADDYLKMLAEQEGTTGDGDKPETAQRLKDIINGFWHDPEVRRYLTGYRAQRDRYNQLMQDGEVPFLLYEKGGKVKIVAIDSGEIVDVIAHPSLPAVPLLWKRRTPTTAGVTAEEWYRAAESYGADKEVKAAVGTAGVSLWGASAKLRDKTPDGTRIWLWMLRVNNADPTCLRGHPPFHSAFPWSAAVQDLVSELRTYLRALSAWAWKEKVAGTSADVSTAKTALASKLDGTNPRPTVGSIRVEGGSRDLEPINVGTGGASSFTVAIEECLKMVYAATGLPGHYFGNVEQGNLATATAMELPVRKLFEAEQRWWTDFYDDVIQFIARVNNIELATNQLIEIDFPAIVEHDAPALLGALSQAKATGVISRDDACRTAALTLGAEDVEDWVGRLDSEDVAAAGSSLAELNAMIDQQPERAAPIVMRWARKTEAALAKQGAAD